MPTKSAVSKKFPLQISLSENTKIVLLVLAYLALFFLQHSKPIITDEYTFLEPAKSLKASLLPTIVASDGTSQIFFAHPPLYIYYLGIFLNFGFPEENVRLLHLPLILLAFFFLWKISTEFFKLKFSNVLFVLLLIPLFLQGTMVISIDSGLLVLLSVAYFYYFLCYLKAGTLQNFTKLVAMAVLLLWAKFSIPLIFFAAAAASMLLIKKSIVDTAKIVVMPAIVFAATWVAYTFFLSVNPLLPFTYVSQRAFETFGNGLYDWFVIVLLNASLANFIIWLNPAIFFGLIFAVFKFGDFFKTENEKALAIFVYVSIAAIATLASGAWNFPIYLTTVVPFIAILVSAKFAENFPQPKVLAAGAILTWLAFYFVYKDPILINIKAEPGNIIRAIFFLLFTLAISAISLKIFERTINIKKLFLLSAIAAGSYFLVLHAVVDYQTGYLYGLHTKAAIEKLKLLPPDGPEIYGPQEITSNLKGYKVHSLEVALKKLNSDNCQIDLKKPLVLVVPSWEAIRNPDLVPIINKCFARNIQTAKFTIAEGKRIDYVGFLIS